MYLHIVPLLYLVLCIHFVVFILLCLSVLVIVFRLGLGPVGFIPF